VSAQLGAGGKPNRFRAWSRQQLYSFFSSLGTLMSHRLGTLMTVLVLGVAMVLPLGLYIAIGNLHELDLHQEKWGTVTAFLHTDAGAEEVAALAGQVREAHGAEVTAVSPEQGMEEFSEASGMGQAMELFEENPLPWVLHVTPPKGTQEDLESVVSRMAGWLDEQETVDFVQVDYKWLKRLAGLLALGDALVTVLAVVLALAVLVVIANTIRLDVSNRAGEIQVLNMVGAPDGFIRQPFLYSGLWYGLMGAALALLFLSAATAYLQPPLQGLLDAYGNSFEFRGLGWWGMAAVLLAGCLLGLAGSWMAVSRHLRQFRVEEMPRRA
jgi:cell division transport system permease protein